MLLLCLGSDFCLAAGTVIPTGYTVTVTMKCERTDPVGLICRLALINFNYAGIINFENSRCLTRFEYYAGLTVLSIMVE